MTNILNKLFVKQREGICLKDSSFWEVEIVKEYPSFLRALIDLVPDQSILYFEGSPSKNLKQYLISHSIPNPVKVARGTLWPTPQWFHIPIKNQIIEELVQLTKDIHPFDLAFHVQAYKDDKILLSWHDAFTQPMIVSKDIPEQKIKEFSQRLGVQYKFYSKGVL